MNFHPFRASKHAIPFVLTWIVVVTGARSITAQTSLQSADAPVVASRPVDDPNGTGLLPDGSVARLGSHKYKTGASINAFAVGRNGESIAIDDESRQIKFIETATGIIRPRPTTPVPARMPCYSPDGRSFACISAGTPYELLLDKGDFRPLKPADDAEQTVAIAFTNSNELLGVTWTDAKPRELRVVNLHDGRELGRLPELAGSHNLVFSSDGKRVISLSSQGPEHIARLWNVETGELIAVRKTPDAGTTLAFTATDIPIAIINDGRRLSVIDIATGKPIRQSVEEQVVSCIGASSECDLFALRIYQEDAPKNKVIVDEDGPGTPANQTPARAAEMNTRRAKRIRPATLSIRRISTGEEVFRKKVPQRLLGIARFSGDGQFVVVADKNDNDHGSSYSLAVWNLTTGNRVDFEPEGHSNPVQSIAFSPDSQSLASTSRDGTLRLWDIAEKNSTTISDDRPINGRSVAFSPDGEFVAATSGGFYGKQNQIAVCDAKSGEPVYGLPVSYISDSASVAFSSDGKYLATGARLPRGGWMIVGFENARAYGSIEVWDRTDLVRFPVAKEREKRVSEPVPAKDFHARGAMSDYHFDVSCLAISDDSTVLAAVGTRRYGKGELSFWKLPGGEAIRTIHRDDWNVGRVAFAPGGKLVATTSSYNLNEDELFNPQAEEVDGWSGDPRRKQIELWNVADGTVAVTLNGHEADVGGIAFSPDGKYVASASLDKTIGIWSVADDARRIATLKGHEGGVLCVAFSPDGKLLASGSADTTILIWDFAKAIKQQPAKP